MGNSAGGRLVLCRRPSRQAGGWVTAHRAASIPAWDAEPSARKLLFRITLAMGGTGLEQRPILPAESHDSKPGNAPHDAHVALPEDLRQIVAAWPHLPAAIRRAMLALIG